jgi:hypothetical protein
LRCFPNSRASVGRDPASRRSYKEIDMGVNVVVIVPNQTGISLEDLIDRLSSDPYGLRSVHGIADHNGETLKGWMEFSWKGQRYFSWIYSPRLSPLDLYQEEVSAPDRDNAVQITFLKIMTLLEKIAGGPVRVGNDVINSRYPDQHDPEEFSLPMPLDALIPDWRDAGAIKPFEIGLVF